MSLCVTESCPALESSSVDITCKIRGTTVSCDQPAEPGTTAMLKCKPSYKIPLTDDPVYREITCLENGSWDRSVFRCLPSLFVFFFFNILIIMSRAITRSRF